MKQNEEYAMTVWFTSDLHLGHARLLELSAARGAALAAPCASIGP